MAHNSDWLGTSRQGKIDMAKKWIFVLGEDGADADGKPIQKRVLWGIPEFVLTALSKAHAAADSALEKGKNEETRTPVVGREIETAFTELESQMRSIKNRFFHIPPLSEADLVSLGLRVKDKTNTPIGKPVNIPGATISYPRPHVVRFRISQWDNEPFDARSAVRVRARWGVFDPEKQGGHYISKVPTTAKELPEDRLMQRKNEDFILGPEDAGKKLFVSLRYENAKGEAGEWGPIIEAIIT